MSPLNPLATFSTTHSRVQRINRREQTDLLSPGQRVVHEIHRPLLVRLGRHRLRLADDRIAGRTESGKGHAPARSQVLGILRETGT